jgi:hypothetical protein
MEVQGMRMAKPVYQRSVEMAAEILGGNDAVAHYLGVNPAEVLSWLEGRNLGQFAPGQHPWVQNPLPAAVFLPDPERPFHRLPDSLLQAIAQEMNLSETTFVYPPSRPDAAARVRRAE